MEFGWGYGANLIALSFITLFWKLCRKKISFFVIENHVIWYPYGQTGCFAYSFACNGISMRVPSAKTYYSNFDSAKRQMMKKSLTLPLSFSRSLSFCVREKKRMKKCLEICALRCSCIHTCMCMSACVYICLLAYVCPCIFVHVCSAYYISVYVFSREREREKLKEKINKREKEPDRFNR